MKKLLYIPTAHLFSPISSTPLPLSSKEIRFFESYFVEAKKFAAGVDKVYLDCFYGINSLEGIKGTMEFALVDSLIEEGAQLMKTESKPLVLVICKLLLNRESKKASEKLCGEDTFKHYLLRSIIGIRRDAYIGRRIDLTLHEGEVAALILGSEHRPHFKTLRPRYLMEPEEFELKTRELDGYFKKIEKNELTIREIGETFITQLKRKEPGFVSYLMSCRPYFLSDPQNLPLEIEIELIK